MSDDRTNFGDAKESDEGSMDTSDTANNKPPAKHRASRAGTRSVATLNPEQLARKRANDREAQRSIRQRTKDHIASLEQRIAVLSAGQHEERIDDVQRRNEELEIEVRQLREALRLVEDSGSMGSSPKLLPMMSSSLGMNGYNESGPYPYSPTWNAPNTYSISRVLPTSFPTSRAGDLMSTLIPAYPPTTESGYPAAGSLTANGFRPSVSASSESMTSGPPRRGTLNNSRPSFGRSRSYPNGSSGRIATMGTLGHTYHPVSLVNNLSNSVSNGIGAPAISIQPQPLAPTVPAPIIEESAAKVNSSIIAQPTDRATYGTAPSFVNPPSLQMWELQLRFVPPTGPVDSILMGLLQRQRNLTNEGATGFQLTGPHKPNFRALIQPETPDFTHPVSSILSNMLNRTSLRGLAEKAAALLVIYQIMRWQISPSPETYANLPEWHTPRASQLLTPHPIWATLVVWGKLRDVVIANQERYASDEFQLVYTSSLNLNWPYGEMDVLVLEDDEVQVTEAFAQHVAKLSSWSLDAPFQARYPELRDVCKFTEYVSNNAGQ